MCLWWNTFNAHKKMERERDTFHSEFRNGKLLYGGVCMSIVALDLYFHENLVSIQYSQWLNDVPWYLREKLHQTPQRGMKKYWSTRKPWMKKNNNHMDDWYIESLCRWFFFAFYNIAGFKCLPVDFRGPKCPQSYNCTFSYFPSATYRLPLKLNIRVVFVCWRIRSSGKWLNTIFSRRPDIPSIEYILKYHQTTKWFTTKRTHIMYCYSTETERIQALTKIKSHESAEHQVENSVLAIKSLVWMNSGRNQFSQEITRVKCSSAQSTRKKRNIAAWKCSVLKHFSKPKFEQPSTPGHSTGLVLNVCTIVCNCLQ